MFIPPSQGKDASATGPDAVPQGARLEVPQTLENHMCQGRTTSCFFGMVISPLKGKVWRWVTKLKCQFRKKNEQLSCQEKMHQQKPSNIFAYHSPESCSFQPLRLVAESLGHFLQQVTAAKNTWVSVFHRNLSTKIYNFMQLSIENPILQKDFITAILFMSDIPSYTIYLANLQSFPTFFSEKKTHNTLSAPNSAEHVHGPTT